LAPKKLIVLGLDGLGLEQARRLAESGVMPNLGGLLNQGEAWLTESPLPEVSPVCWSSMFSGANPGEHGVFGFGHPVPGAYRIKPVDAAGVKVSRLWERMSAANRRSVVLNVPLTYPARPLVGVMVSGFVVVSLERAVYPLDILDKVKQTGYRPEADMDRGITDPHALARDLARVIDARLALFEQMLEEECELYVAVITDTDRINHFFWQALHTPDHPLQGRAEGLFSRIDRFIGRLWGRIGKQVQDGETALLLAADHSFGPIESEVYLNRWLVQKGYLKVAGEPGKESIQPGTVALALDPGRIYLHKKGRFPLGHLADRLEADAVCDQISKELLELKLPDSGRPVLDAIHKRQEIYEGPCRDEAPDLVARAASGISLRAGLGMPGVFGRSHLEGTHLPHGAMALWLGPKLQSKPPAVQGLYDLMARTLQLN
jgi:predicted AlkP superfamily phosphohydrolase/phosphomutase